MWQVSCLQGQNKATKLCDTHCPHQPGHANTTDRLLTLAAFGDRWLRFGHGGTSIKLTLTPCSLVNKCALIDEEKIQKDPTKRSFPVRKTSLRFEVELAPTSSPQFQGSQVI